MPRLLFVIGSARSGTTWVQLLLARHPGIVTAQETHLFMHYLAPLEKRYRFDEQRGADQRRVGLPTVLSREELLEILRDVSRRVFARMDASSGAADVLLYKGAESDSVLIHEAFPDAYFLHVVRDPRAVASSMRAASATFGRHWAKPSLADATEHWRAAVESCRGLAAAGARYLEVRYEDLSAQAEAELGRIAAWLGLEWGAEARREAAEACRIDRLRSPAPGGTGSDGQGPWDLSREPAGFFRRGEADAWREELTDEEVAVVEYVAGPLLGELGYRRRAPDAGRPPRLGRYERRKALAARLRRLAAAVAARLEGRRP